MLTHSKRRAANLQSWRPRLEKLEARLVPGACFWESGRTDAPPLKRLEESSRSALIGSAFQEGAPPEITEDRRRCCETYAYHQATHSTQTETSDHTAWWPLEHDVDDTILQSPTKHPIDDPWSDDLSRPNAFPPHYGGYSDAWDTLSSTYLGGSNPGVRYVIALNGATGGADSTNLRAFHPLQANYTRGANMFMTELNAYGTLAYSTYLRGYPDQGIPSRPTNISASTSDKPKCKPESTTEPALTLRSDEEGCCFVLGQGPFPATRQECDKVGGRFNPDPCPLA